jgi:tetratricopeptide (TPR) repeat protein
MSCRVFPGESMPRSVLLLAAVALLSGVAVAEELQVNPDKGRYPGTVKEPVPALRPADTEALEDLKESLTGDATPEAAVPDPGPGPQDPVLQAAEQALAEARWANARAKAEEVLKKDKKAANAWVILGRADLGEKKYRNAIRKFDKALKYHPHKATAFYGKGQAFEAMGRLDEAGNEYQAAIHADPRMVPAREAWQRIQGRLGLHKG